jgi:hypothetical protein
VERSVVIDGTAIPIPKGVTAVGLWKNQKGSWEKETGSSARGAARHPGGGIADLFMQPLRIVYGTQVPGREADLESAARRIADWSPTSQVQIGDKTGRFPVRADTEITPAELSSCGILLIGNREENAVSRRVSATIGSYYRNGIVTISGMSFPDQGLMLALPSPFAPGRLMGYIDAPRSLLGNAAAIESWFTYFPFRFRMYRVDETATYPGFVPDVAVITSNPYWDAWSGWFDRNWQNLSGR